MIRFKDLKTGMKVRTRTQGDFYVILDWTHQKGEKTQCTGLLIKTSYNHEVPWLFAGLLGYKEDLTFSGDDDWDITNVYIYTGTVLDEMEAEENEALWKEITEPVQYDQDMLIKYFSRF